MSTEHDYDLLVLGAGSGGVRAARMSATHGARVAVFEAGPLGGTCVNVGCVPKKLFATGAHFSDAAEDAKAYGWDLEVKGVDWPTLLRNKDAEIARLNGVYERLLDNAGVEIVHGFARVVDPHTVEVDGKRYTSRYILVATGGWPTIPDVPGKELGITSNEAFHLERLPKRAVIVGGGYIACEFASIFHGYGSEVTVVHRGQQVLRGFDDDVRAFIGDQLRERGITLHLNCTVDSVAKDGEALKVTLADGTVLGADCLMFATGRAPRTQDLGLEAAGVKLDAHGAIVVDDRFQTSVPSIYALGDVTDRVKLTPVAIAEAMVLSANLFAGADRRLTYADIPTAVFSHPQIGTVGLTEEEARRLGPVKIFKSVFRPLKHTLTGRSEKTLMKLVVDRDTDRVLGCHVAGDDAAEMVQGFAVAITCGATKAQLDATIGIHPTSAEELVTMRTPEPEEPDAVARTD